MDEPMEESHMEVLHAAPPSTPEMTNNTSKPSASSMLRAGSMVLMTITMEDYEQTYWPKLEAAINQLLTMSPGDYIPISYEQMYSCVYKCVCKQFSQRLYSDLLRQITAHLEQLSLELQSQDSCVYIERFYFALNQYTQALGGIVPIFNYMNRFYVESKLKTDLGVELRQLFVQYVADKHVNAIIPLMVDASSKPFSVSPNVMANLIKNIHALKPEYAQLRPQLFAKYLPNILPPCTERELNRYIEEAKQMQRDLLTNPEFIRGDKSKKRQGEDEPIRTPSLTNVEPSS